MTGRPHDDPVYRANRAILKRTSKRYAEPCARCGEPIDYSAHYLEPSAFTAGHIVAVVDGGTHQLSNLRAEHRGCNLAAGGRAGNRRRWQPSAPTWVPSRQW